MTSVVVVGIGREMRGDDAAGLRAVRKWQAMFPETARRPDVRVELITAPDTTLLEALRGARAAVLVDAVRGGRASGSVHLLDAVQLSARGSGSGTAHGWGVAETLGLARIVDPESLPERVAVVGIEVGEVRVGTGLTPRVGASIEKTARLIQTLIAREVETTERTRA